MKLEEAIEILEMRAKDYMPGYDPYECNAVKLGIEAMIAVKYVRRNYPKILTALLPGETKE